MPFVVEYTMKRPNKEVDFPVEDLPQKDVLSNLREDYDILSEVTFSEDGLTRTLRHTAKDANTYNDFYTQAQPCWEKAKILPACSELNIDLTMDIVENT